MKRRIFLLVLGLLLSVTGTWASMPKVDPVIEQTVGGVTIRVEFLANDILKDLGAVLSIQRQRHLVTPFLRTVPSELPFSFRCSSSP